VSFEWIIFLSFNLMKFEVGLWNFRKLEA